MRGFFFGDNSGDGNETLIAFCPDLSHVPMWHMREGDGPGLDHVIIFYKLGPFRKLVSAEKSNFPSSVKLLS